MRKLNQTYLIVQKSTFKNVTGVDTSDFAKKMISIIQNLILDQLNIDKLKIYQTV